MEPIPPKQQDMIDVTDSLEAVDAARRMRFFLFWFILFPALLVLQVIFWLNFAGHVESKDAPAESAVSFFEALMRSDAVALAAEIPQPEEPQAEQLPAEQPQPSDIEQGVSDVTGTNDDIAAVEPAQPKENVFADVKLPYRWAVGIVKVCNFFILAAVVLYCLIILLCLKISLVGRLGGIYHITKCFLVSLLLLVVLFPWQVLAPRVMLGAVWLPNELFAGWQNISDSIFWTVLYFLRFSGMWLLAMFLLFWSRSRFVKWRRATLRRLGVLR